MFLGACDDFHRLKSSKNRFKSAKHIIETFILEGSVLEINIGQQHRQRIIHRWNLGTSAGDAEDAITPDRCPKTLFDEISSLVMFQLKTDVFPRFITSRDFSALLRSLVRQESLIRALLMLGAESNDNCATHSSIVRGREVAEEEEEQQQDMSNVATLEDMVDLVSLSSENDTSDTSDTISLSESMAAADSDEDNGDINETDHEKAKRLVKKYISVFEKEGPARARAYDFKRIRKLTTVIEADNVIWKEAYHDPHKIHAWVSRPFFQVGNCKRIHGYRIFQNYDCTYEQLCKIATNTLQRIQIDGMLASLKYWRHVSLVDTMRERLEQLIQRKNVRPSEFNSITEYSFVISYDIYKLPFPLKKRSCYMMSSMRHFPDQKRFVLARRTCEQSDLKKQRDAMVTISAIVGDIYEACGPNDSHSRRVTLGVSNLGTVLPSRLMSIGISKRTQDQFALTNNQISECRAASTLDSFPTDEWGKALWKTVEENTSIDAMVKEYMLKYYGTK